MIILQLFILVFETCSLVPFSALNIFHLFCQFIDNFLSEPDDLFLFECLIRMIALAAYVTFYVIRIIALIGGII